MLQKENKQNSNMTWQKYKLNLRNSHLLEEFFQSWRNLTPCFHLLSTNSFFMTDKILVCKLIIFLFDTVNLPMT